MGAFQNLNSQGYPVDVANASPTLFNTSFKNLSVTTTPGTTSDTDNIYVLASQYYGLGSGSTNPLAITANFTATAIAEMRIYVNGSMKGSKAVAVGVNTISTDEFDLDIAINFGDTVYLQLVRGAADCAVTLGSVLAYQRG